jgi:hypothetical protein
LCGNSLNAVGILARVFKEWESGWKKKKKNDGATGGRGDGEKIRARAGIDL